MPFSWKLRKVQARLARDIEKTTVPFEELARRYGVSKQAISLFYKRKGSKDQRENTF